MSNLVYPIYKLPEFKLQGITPWSKWWIIKKSRGSSGLTEQSYLPTKYNYYFKDFQIEGNSKQKTYEGYNIFNCEGIRVGTGGIQITGNKDGTITIKGTCTSNVYPNITSYVSTFDYNLGSSYILTDGLSNHDNIRISLEFTGGSIFSDGIKNTIMSIPYNAYIRVGPGTYDLTIKPMLRLETDPSVYEPYVGGIASPNPEYPQEIKSAGDDENFININDFEITRAGIKFKCDNGVIMTSGTSTGNGYHYFTDSSNLAEINKHIGETLTFSISGIIDDNMYVGFRIGNDNYKVILNKNTLSKTILLTEEIETIRIEGYNPSGKLANSSFGIKIQKGTIATPYSPYGMGLITEKVQNRNLFINEWEQGNISADTGKNVSSQTRVRCNYIEVKPNITYYMSRDIFSDFNTFRFYDKNYNYLGSNATTGMVQSNRENNNMIGGTKDITFKIINENVCYMRIADQSNNLNVKYLLQLSSIEDKTYIDHHEQNLSIPTQEPLKQVGNFRDRFINISGQWFEEHIIKRKYFDGTEAGTLFNGVFYTIIPDYLREYNEITSNSNYFEGIKNPYGINDMPEDKDNFCCFRTIESDNLKYFYITSKQFTSIQSFQAWLAEKDTQGNPVYIDYVLDEPYLLPCTNEQSEELNKTYKLRTYSGGTNITSQDEVPANIVVEYVGSPIVQGEEIMNLNEESEVEENDI